MPHDPAKYPKDWPAISKRIKERDGYRCKFCRVHQYAVIESKTRRYIGGNLYLDDLGYANCYKDAREICDHENGEPERDGRYIVVVLTCAHLHDPDPMNCQDRNLAALCQKCHLRWDANQRARTAARAQAKKLLQPDLI
jgi:hypothetical protein